MFGRKRRARALRQQANVQAFYEIQSEVDLILLVAMGEAVQEHPEWTPLLQEMLYG